VFLLSRLGVNIEGLDIHAPTVERLRAWAREHGFDCTFQVGDVQRLPYPDDSLAGYLSFGVIEHFIEGPQQPLAEACRALRPGGVAVITTPAPSFSQQYFRARAGLKKILKRMLGRPIQPRPFFQYWYGPKQLARHVGRSGLQVVLAGGADLKYAAWELGARPSGRALAFRAADLLERTALSAWGAQALSVSIKVADEMYCFLCGEFRASRADLAQFYLPVCRECADEALARFYRDKRPPSFNAAWRYEPVEQHQTQQPQCSLCEAICSGDPLFDGHCGFSVPICPSCLKQPSVNLAASNQHLLPIWRSRV
jgi:SAM-dependent methyltransferase